MVSVLNGGCYEEERPGCGKKHRDCQKHRTGWSGRSGFRSRSGHHHDASVTGAGVRECREPAHVLGNWCFPCAAHPLRELGHGDCREIGRLHQAQPAGAPGVREKQLVQHGTVLRHVFSRTVPGRSTPPRRQSSEAAGLFPVGNWKKWKGGRNRRTISSRRLENPCRRCSA